jgi:hypothetical protein
MWRWNSKATSAAVVDKADDEKFKNGSLPDLTLMYFPWMVHGAYMSRQGKLRQLERSMGPGFRRGDGLNH